MLDNDVSVVKFLSFGTQVEPALALFKNVPTRPGVHGFKLRSFFKKVKNWNNICETCTELFLAGMKVQ